MDVVTYVFTSLFCLTYTGYDTSPSEEAVHNRGLLWLCQELIEDISVPTGTFWLLQVELYSVNLVQIKHFCIKVVHSYIGIVTYVLILMWNSYLIFLVLYRPTEAACHLPLAQGAAPACTPLATFLECKWSDLLTLTMENMYVEVEVANILCIP